jgi:hypothetical protein
LSTGDRNNLEQRRREDVEKAREVVRDEPSTLQSKRRSHPWHIDTFEFVGPQAVTVCFQFVREPRRTTIRVFEVNMSKISAQPGGDNRNTGKDREVFMVLP